MAIRDTNSFGYLCNGLVLVGLPDHCRERCKSAYGRARMLHGLLLVEPCEHSLDLFRAPLPATGCLNVSLV